MGKYNQQNAILPIIQYTNSEIRTWREVYLSYQKIIENHACDQVKEAFYLINKQIKFNSKNIPQLFEVSDKIHQLNSWRIRPVPGLISDKDYLEGLANKVYCSTQIIRREQDLTFSPYPDYIHDLLGHIIPIANNEISQKLNLLGRLSISATPEQVEQIAFIYWKVFEMGFIKTQSNQYKALGGAVLSSQQELMNVSNKNVKISHIREFKIIKKYVEDEDLQNEYYYIDTLDDIDEIVENLKQKWHQNKTAYNPQSPIRNPRIQAFEEDK
ncbi:tyrosine 3-monooxygenase-like [Stylonychia lemnae]|uniref:phenylalanine 4-monooxygenase n=1 Tax=Stylonychia lemnae TaxID=5949 RepID=A0A078ADT9_STYLE|nr:tyrosine 3-monooxygenase-like [Stylonychia lemnae]|eukprot:CDW79073.1 tyrosine 3-monooxygenase-like [Stylonychia lemnae]